RDPDPAVRREVALGLQDTPLDSCESLMLALVDGFDGNDPWYLSALGISLKGKEEAFYPKLLDHFASPDPEAWPDALAALVWELHPKAAVHALEDRISADKLSTEEKKRSLV